MGAAKRSRELARPIPVGWVQGQGTRSPAQGSPGPALGPGPTDEPGDDPPPRRRVLRGVRAAETIGLVLAVIASMVLLLDDPGPQDVAQEYLEAVLAGDASVLRTHLVSSEGSTDIALRDEVLTGAEDRITSYRIDSVETLPGRAMVTATLRSTTGIASITLTLLPSDEGPFRPIRWKLEPVRLPELSVVIPPGVEAISVNGVEIDLAQPLADLPGRAGPRTLALSMLPGTYEVGLPERGALVTPAGTSLPVPLRLGQWRSGHAIVLYELTEAGERAARTAIRAELRSCARSTRAQPEGCPFGIDPDSDVSAPEDPASGEWEITRMPLLRYEHAMAYGWIFTGGEGEARFTTTGRDPATGQETTVVRAVPLELHAVVQSHGETAFSVSMISRDCTLTVRIDGETGALNHVPGTDCA